MNLEFLYQDKYFFAVKKESNIHSVINPNIKDESIAFYLKEKFPFLENVSKNKEDSGLLNRLDFQTSGILFGAWDKDSWNIFHEKNNEIVKTYIAICEGNVKDYEIKTYLGGKYRGSKKVSVYPLDTNPKRATIGETKIHLLSFNKEKNISLVEATIISAKRHQIRAHLSYLGHTLVGDALYGSNIKLKNILPEFQNRDFLLHNTEIKFFHPILKKEIVIENKIDLKI